MTTLPTTASAFNTDGQEKFYQSSIQEVESSYQYLSGYQKPLDITDQIDILRSHWPQPNPDRAIRYMREVYPTLQLPLWVEGPFALIRPGFFSNIYGEELEEVFKVLAKVRNNKFVNCCEGQLGPEYLRQRSDTVAMTHRVMEQQPDSDLIIGFAQFGIRHRGCSVQLARRRFIAGEFGEGAKNSGTMLLTHPHRLQHHDDLWIDCAGDEFSPDGDGHFSRTPGFNFPIAILTFGAEWFDTPSAACGSITAIVLKNPGS